MNQPWYCNRCGQENHPNSTTCFECRTPRPPHTYAQGEGPGVTYGPPQQGFVPPPPPKKSNAPIAIIVTCLVIVLLVIVAGTCMAISLPNYIKIKEKAKEAEIKQNLHSIQLGVERFATDHDRTYPKYLIGGEARCARETPTSSEQGNNNDVSAFRDIVDCTAIETVSDPLLREGYLSSYPKNPFTRNGAALHLLQKNLSSTPAGMDPMRNGSESGLALGTRFGSHCTLMGSVLADIRFNETTVETEVGKVLVIDTGADTEYQYWDMWQGNKPLPFIPGMFFYKGLGPDVIPDDGLKSEGIITPSVIDNYMLGTYGGVRTKGSDILGAESPVADKKGNKYWTYLRSEVSTDPGHVQGCPYSFISTSDKPKVVFENPNGIRDAVILILTSN